MTLKMLAATAALSMLVAGVAHAQDYYDGTPPYASGAYGYAGYDNGGSCDGFTIAGAHAGVTVLGINVGGGARARIGGDCHSYGGGYGGGYAAPAGNYVNGGYYNQQDAYPQGGYADQGYAGQGYAPVAYPSQPVYAAPSYGYSSYQYSQPVYSAPSYGQPCGCQPAYGYQGY